MVKNPSEDEQHKGPAPSEEEQRPTDRDQGNADQVAQLVQWVLMLRLVIVDERFGH